MPGWGCGVFLARAAALAAPGAALPLVSIKVLRCSKRSLHIGGIKSALELKLFVAAAAAVFVSFGVVFFPPRSEMKASYSLSMTSGLTVLTILAKTAPGRRCLQSDAEKIIT